MQAFRVRQVLSLTAILAVLASACGGSSSGTVELDAASEEVTTTAPPASTSTVAESPSTSAPEPAEDTTTTQLLVESALNIDGSRVSVQWENLGTSPFYAQPSGDTDPFFHIHTNPAEDGFFLSFEFYTTGYGQQWAGETGTFAISCADAINSTGICPYFDPDGPGPEPVLGDDFGAEGSLTIVQLDAGGYEIVVHELVFTDGTTFDEFTMAG